MKLTIEDWSYQQHHDRQLAEVTPDAIRQRMKVVQASAHYRYGGSQWQIGAYEGCGILAMLDDDEQNLVLTNRLVQAQQAILGVFDEGTWYALPAASYHQTVANMLSNARFHSELVNRGLLPKVPALVREAFENHSIDEIGPGNMRIAGIALFGSAIGALGVFDNEEDYRRITRFRSQFYGDDRIRSLGIAMTRPFVAHITLGYFGSTPEGRQAELLIDVINSLNADFQRKECCFRIGQVGLRRYENLSDFRAEADFPIVKI